MFRIDRTPRNYRRAEDSKDEILGRELSGATVEEGEEGPRKTAAGYTGAEKVRFNAHERMVSCEVD